MNNNFTLVDEVVKEVGGTATIFVKSGADYVRVATNVKRDDGSRAIGTILDPKGKVIEFINKNEAFYGEATILGKPYLTGYEPMHDALNNVIGIYYFGYLVSGSLTSQEQQTLKREVKMRGCDGSEMDPDVSKAPYRPLRGVRGGYSRRLRKVLGTVN
jgi:hypothetical protein